MLDIEITGEQHPKTITVVTEGGDTGVLSNLLSEWGAEDPLYKQWKDTAPGEDGKVRMEIPQSIVGDFHGLIDADWPEAAEKIQAMIEDAIESRAQ